MITRILTLIGLSLFLTSCLGAESDDSPAVPSAPTLSPSIATATSAASPTSTEEIPASPTRTMTATADAEVPVIAPTADICLHSLEPFWPKIFIMNADGTNVRRVTPEGVMDAWDPAWSQDGSQIVFGGTTGQNGGLFIMDRDGKHVRHVTGGDGDSREPAWSPDGERIVFVRQHPDAGGTHLYVIDRDGSNLRQLTTFPGYVDTPAWSPDGTRIAYASGQDGNYEIYVIDADGTNLKRLTERPTWEYGPIWSADGAQIVFESGYFATGSQSTDERDTGIFVMDADGSNVQRVDALQAGDRQAQWSPASGEIAFVHDYEIMVADSDGANRRNLTQHPLSDEWPRWSPDGREILFVSNRDLWPLAKPGTGRPEPIVLRAGGSRQKGGAGTFCESIENGFRSSDVFGVWLPPAPLIAEAGASVRFDFSGFQELAAFEITVYDYSEAQRIHKLVNGVLTAPCAPPGGEESTCIVQHIAERVGTAMAGYDLKLSPGHYAILVRANFGAGNQRGYTEQGFNLVVE